LKRHSQFVHAGRTKPISVPRTDPALIVDCDEFAKQCDALIATKRLTASSLVTYYETVIGFNAGKWKAQRWMLPGEPNHALGGKGVRIGSLINFVNAAGEHLLAVWVLKKISKKKKVDDQKRLIAQDLVIPLDEVRVHYRGVPVYYMYTETGFISAVTIIPVMQCFMNVWKIRHSVNNDLSTASSTYCWVLSDRLAAHRSPELLEMMILHHFHDVLFFSPRSVPTCQPQKNSISTFKPHGRGIHSGS